MKMLFKLDKIEEKIIKKISGFMMIFIVIIVNAMVFSRYVFRVNMGGIEELPVYLMIGCVWLGAVSVAKKDAFVKIEIVDSFVKNQKIKKIIKIFNTFLSAVVITIFSKYAFVFFTRSIKYKDLSPAIGFPIWWVHIVVFIGSLGIAIYFWVNTIKYIREIKEQ